jgi:hypothetical protein
MALNTGGRYITAEGFYIWGPFKAPRLLGGLVNGTPQPVHDPL